jgi:hypothetical protein
VPVCSNKPSQPTFGSRHFHCRCMSRTQFQAERPDTDSFQFGQLGDGAPHRVPQAAKQRLSAKWDTKVRPKPTQSAKPNTEFRGTQRHSSITILRHAFAVTCWRAGPADIPPASTLSASSVWRSWRNQRAINPTAGPEIGGSFLDHECPRLVVCGHQYCRLTPDNSGQNLPRSGGIAEMATIVDRPAAQIGLE